MAPYHRLSHPNRHAASSYEASSAHHRWDCAYPGVELLPDGRILSVTYGHWTQGESPWIAAVHFRASEMLKRLGD